jgi:hypothetical protein
MCEFKNKKIPSTFVHLKYLNCSYCPRLKQLPSQLVSIINIACTHCLGLKRIPSTWISVHNICCSDCVSLNVIPLTLRNVKLLDCENCPILRLVPKMFIPQLLVLNSPFLCFNRQNERELNITPALFRKRFCGLASLEKKRRNLKQKVFNYFVKMWPAQQLYSTVNVYL